MNDLCPMCHRELIVLKSGKRGKPENFGRPFAKCENPAHFNESFRWLDEEPKRGKYADARPLRKPDRPASLEVFSSSSEARENNTKAVGENTSKGAGQEDDGTGNFNPLNFLKIDPVAPVAQANFKPSHYQQDIFDFVQGGEGNATVEAVAGSGKSTTLVRSLEYTPRTAEVAFVAFNKHIVKELDARAPSHVHVSTLHSLGLANVLAAMPDNKPKVNEYKLFDLWGSVDPFDHSPELKPVAAQLVDLCKATMRPPTPEVIDSLIDHYTIDVDGDLEKLYELVPDLYNRSVADRTQVDFTDMVHLCATGEVKTKKFDVFFVDELQDFSDMQLQMALNSVRDGGRILGVGDSKQAIYGFSGAGIDSMDKAREFFKGQSFPLSICYRCHKGAIRLAKEIVPQIEWRDDAPEGIVDEINDLSGVRPGDMVLCRINAPLVEPCFKLIARGIPAKIRGRNIGDGLIAMLGRGEKKAKSNRVSDVIEALDKYVSHEVDKLRRARKELRASTLQDQFDTLFALSDGCYTIGEIRRKVAQTFSDEKAAVIFSSVHKAKGLESERVFILNPELMPYPKAELPWQVEQEMNCKYIALTRAKQELYFVKTKKSW